jgi:hypothetical protein
MILINGGTPMFRLRPYHGSLVAALVVLGFGGPITIGFIAQMICASASSFLLLMRLDEAKS